MTPDSQLLETTGVFDHHSFECWLDAGSLLGAIRDGELLSWDKDIDFGCWSDQLPALRRVIESLRQTGYTARVQQYRGNVHKVQFRPQYRQLREGMRTIDVTVYRRRDDIAWCPVNCVQPQPRRRFSLRWFLEKPVREAFIRPWQRRDDRRARTIRFPRLQLDVRTWVVPARFFLTLDDARVQDVRVRIPSAAEAYLSLRYGDWREPAASWNYCEDDGVMVRNRPEDALAWRA